MAPTGHHEEDGKKRRPASSFRAPNFGDGGFERKIDIAIVSTCAVVALFVGFVDSKETKAIFSFAEAVLVAIIWLIPPAIIAWIAKRLALSWKAAFVFTFVVIAVVFYLLRQYS